MVEILAKHCSLYNKYFFVPIFGVMNFLVGGQYLCYDWCWGTVHSEGACEQNISTVAVIDGGLYIEKYSAPQCQMQTSLI